MKKRTVFRIVSIWLSLCLIMALSGCAGSPNPATTVNDRTQAKYAVSSSSAEAAAVGMAVLENGGNAVDAAAAVSLVLSVVEPYGSGIGGGGFMLVYDPKTQTAQSLDYYAAAGGAAMQTDDVGVPGLLRGLQTALDLWGTKSLSELIDPAIEYAEKGFSASKILIERVRLSAKLQDVPSFSGISVGSRVVQPELAKTLRLIKDQGIDAFYAGSIAQNIAKVCGLSAQDLANYRVYLMPAVQTEAYGYQLYGTNAPSSGFTTLQMVALSERINLPSPAEDTPGYLNDFRKIKQAAYRSRNKSLVDPRFYPFDDRQLLSDAYLDSLLFSNQTAESLPQDPEKICTTQFSVIDSDGLVVCVTNTLSNNWGSYQMVDGFFLNNTLSNFGSSQTLAYWPNKRPRTHFSPVIVTGDDGFVLAIGSPGGSNIPQIVSAVLIDILRFSEQPQAAVDKARVFIDDDGYAIVEATDKAASIVDTSQIPFGYYYSGSHLFFGCTSIVGCSKDLGVFSVDDMRRTTSDAETTRENFFGW